MQLSHRHLSFNFRFVLVAFLAIYANSSGLRAAVFSLPDKSVQPGPVSLPLTMSGLSGASTITFTLAWDKDALQYTSYTKDLSPIGFTVDESQTGNGLLGVRYIGTIPVASELTLMTFSFSANSSSAVTFQDGPIRPLSPTTDATWDSGSVEVVPEPVNVALGLFAGFASLVCGFRKLLRTSQLSQ